MSLTVSLTASLQSFSPFTTETAFVVTDNAEANIAELTASSLSDYKSAHIECLTEDEIKLINVINDYYRKVDKKYEEFVALDCLGLDVQEKVSFDRKKMRDINNPRGNDFVSAVEIYVPALYMENGGDIEKKALIKGE